MHTCRMLLAVIVVVYVHSSQASSDESPPSASPQQIAPAAEERQLPFEMHAEMQERPQITVGHHNATIVGQDNQALQAAVDYIAALGGGVVEIGPGEYLMRDSLHLRSHVTVRGTPGRTILRKAAGADSPLAMDGDFGEQQFTVADATGFAVGSGVAIWDTNASGFHITVARITGRSGKTFSIDKPLMADCLVSRDAQAATIFPVVSGYDLRGARIEGLTVEGGKQDNLHLDGCRGGGIFLYRAFGTVIDNCIVRNYHGDGISFQQSNDVAVTHCTSEGNTHLGLHPGSGSQRPIVRDCIARKNGSDGLFLCWRVRHGLFENNVLDGNGRFGISIGHKDSDNLLQKNHVLNNALDGVMFRNESYAMAAHRNRLVDNLIENNGTRKPAAGIRIRGETQDLHFAGNTIRDTREKEAQTQTTGILIEASVGEVELAENEIESSQPVDDRREPDGP